MKLRITFKDPDGVSNSIKEAVLASVADMDDADTDEKEAIVEIRTEKVQTALEKWLSWNEYVTILFDTDTGTAVVCETKQ